MSRRPVGAQRTRGVSDDASERGRRVVAAWATPSTHGAAVYETLLYADGSLSCNCPGVGLPAEGRPRACRHTRTSRPRSRGCWRAAATGPARAGTRPTGAGSGAIPNRLWSGAWGHGSTAAPVRPVLTAAARPLAPVEPRSAIPMARGCRVVRHSDPRPEPWLSARLHREPRGSRAWRSDTHGRRRRP